MATATVSFRAELKNLRAELASIPDLTATEARKAVSNLNKSMKALERTNARAAKSTRKSASATSALGMAAQSTAMQIPDVISQAQMGTPALTIFTQQGLQVAQQAMVGMGAAGPIAAAAIAGLATTAGVGYVAWKAYNDESHRAARISETVKAAQEARVPIVDALRVATLDLKVATGELSEENRKLLDISARAFDTYQDSTEEARKKLGELKKEQASVGTQMLEVAQAYAPAWTPLGLAIRSVSSDSEELQREIDALSGEITTAIDLTGKLSERGREAAKVTDERAASSRRATKALSDEQKAGDRLRRSLIEERQARQEASEALGNIAADAEAARLTTAERLTQEYEQQLMQIEMLGDASGNQWAEEQARHETRMAYESRLADHRKALVQSIAAEERRQQLEIQAAVQKRVADGLTAASTLTNGLAQMSSMLATQMAEENIAAARRMFAFYKAMAITQTVIDTAAAVMRAIRDLGPVAGPVAAVGIGALGAAKAGLIAGQQFPSFPIGGAVRSGVVGPKPGHVPVMVEPGEHVVSRSDVARNGGEHGVRAALSAGPGPTIMVPAFSVGHLGRITPDFVAHGTMNKRLRNASTRSTPILGRKA